jgi:hypothetical protein
MIAPAEMLYWVERELSKRRRAYPRLVQRRQISLPQVDGELRTIEALADHLRELAEPDRVGFHPG